MSQALTDHALERLVADARATLGGATPAETPRFELFHAANSICSQKVRTVLAYHALDYLGQNVNLFLGQTYRPGYVRLRMAGCERFGGALVSHHSGSTSASAGGCDGAVVPTLVDWDTGDVIVDSKKICLYLDGLMPEADRLRPPGLAATIDAEIEVVDNIPNYQLLMGRTPAASESDTTKGNTNTGFSMRKVAWCDQYLQEYADEPALVAAYTAKRAKELSAVNELFSAEAMRTAYAKAEEALQGLEGKLEPRTAPWLYGSAPTMADLFWGIELLRMKDVGAARFWEGGRLPRVARMLAATEALPSIQTAILTWPGAMF